MTPAASDELDLAWGEVEAIAVLLGGAKARARAARALDELDGIGGLLRADRTALARCVGRTGAARLTASLWLGRRLLQALPRSGRPIGCADDAWRIVAPGLSHAPEERLHALLLDRGHRVLALRELTRGSDAYTVVDPRQILRAALGVGAHAIVLAHNHPSGDPHPSVQDREVTRRVAAACQAIGLRLLDHLVLGNGAWSSMASLGVLGPWGPADMICTG